MRASDFIKKGSKRSLTIFDIDDTLFHTTAKIKVVKNGSVVRTLTNQEFNTYKLQPGEEYDFGEFRSAEKFRQESLPIGPMLDELKTILDHTQGKVIFLTAREDFDDKETFLQTFKDHGIDMSKIHVHRAGNLPGNEIPAEKKAVWVRRYLDTGNYSDVSLYDDSTSNLRVFKELKKEYPKVSFHAYHITGHGNVSKMEQDELEERKKRKRKSKRSYGAIWGPGPYGLYGWNAGYSGDGGGGDGGGVGEQLDTPTPTLISIAKKHNISPKYLKHQLSIGIDIEKEHTSDINLAKEIALDHLGERPDYYEKLKKYVEKSNKQTEAAYPGNIGAMELAKFWRTAGPDEKAMLKKLLDKNDYRRAWALIQGVTGVKLVGKEFATETAQPQWSELEIAIMEGGHSVEDSQSFLENFADGKKPGRKGLAKRTGVNCKQSVSKLRKIAKNSSGERQRMAHWCANMKSGRDK